MVLECWSLVLNDICDPGAKIHYAVYNRLGLLLKSLICVSRVTPAYRIARHQLGADYRVISRMNLREKKLSHLGESKCYGFIIITRIILIVILGSFLYSTFSHPLGHIC